MKPNRISILLYASAAIALIASLMATPVTVGPDETVTDGEKTYAGDDGVETNGAVTINGSAIVTMATDGDSQITLNDGVTIEPGVDGRFEAYIEANAVALEFLINSMTRERLAESDKLLSPSQTADAYFGVGVGMDRINDRMIVRDMDQAYVYDFTNQSWKTLSPTGDAQLGAGEVSNTVAIYGDWAVIGSPYTDVGLDVDTGVVYVFRFNGTDWVEQAPLASPETNAQFGYSVSIYDDQLIVGAREAMTTDTALGLGRAHVYRLEGDVWTYQETLSHQWISGPGQASENLGSAVSIFDDKAVAAEAERVILDPQNPADQSPQVQLYDRSGPAWSTSDTRIDPSDSPNTRFGWSVSLSGNVAAIGAPHTEQDGQIDVGAVYIYEYDAANGWGATPSHTLRPWDFEAGHYYGHSVELFGDTLVVGRGPGEAVYIYRHDSFEDSWDLLHTLVSDDAATQFGFKVSLGENYIAIAREGDDAGAQNAGSVYTFQLPDAVTPPVTTPNGAPDTNPDTGISVFADATIEVDVLANDSDPDNNPLTVLYASGNMHGEVSVTNGSSVQYTPGSSAIIRALAQDANLSDSFEYGVTDGIVATPVPEIVYVTIVGVNDAPEVASQPEPAYWDENGSYPSFYDLNAIFNDIDAGEDSSLQFAAALVSDSSGSQLVDGGTLLAWMSLNAGVFGGTPTFDDSGVYYVRFTATDPHAESENVTVRIIVADVVPVTVDDSGATISEGIAETTFDVLPNDFDPRGAGLSISRIGDGVGPVTGNYGQFSIDGNQIKYVLDNANPLVNALSPASDPLTDSVSYRVSDGTDESLNEATATITITGINDDIYRDTSVTFSAPTAVAGQSSYSYTLPSGLFTDADEGDPVDITVLSGAPAWLTYDGATQTFSGDIPVDQTENVTVQIQASDDGSVLNDSFVINVEQPEVPATGPLVAVDDTIDLTEDDQFAVQTSNTFVSSSLLDNDFDTNSDPFNVAEASQTTFTGIHGDLTINSDGTFIYERTPPLNHQEMKNGDSVSDGFQYEITNGNETVNAMVTVTINGVNALPVAVDSIDPGITVQQGLTITLPISGTDEEDGTLTISEANTTVFPANGAIIWQSNQWEYTPNFDFVGAETITYTVSDLDGHTSEAGEISVQVTVDPVATLTSLRSADRILGPDNSDDSYFGVGVAMDQINDRMIVRDRYDAHIYEFSNGSWNRIQTLSPPSPGTELTYGRIESTVAIHGNYAAISSPFTSVSGETSVGIVFVYERNPSSNLWSLHGTVPSPSPTEFQGLFGSSIAINEDRLVVGARGIDDATHSQKEGKAFVYNISQFGVGGPIELVVPVSQGFAKGLGASVAIFGDFIAVGSAEAPFGSDFESVRIFKYDNG